VHVLDNSSSITVTPTRSENDAICRENQGFVGGGKRQARKKDAMGPSDGSDEEKEDDDSLAGVGGAVGVVCPTAVACPQTPKPFCGSGNIDSKCTVSMRGGCSWRASSGLPHNGCRRALEDRG
jgi:hypothetical protein